MDKKSLLLGIAKAAAQIGGAALASQGHQGAAQLVNIGMASADEILAKVAELAPHVTEGQLTAEEVHAHFTAARAEAQGLVADAIAGNQALDRDA